MPANAIASSTTAGPEAPNLLLGLGIQGSGSNRGIIAAPARHLAEVRATASWKALCTATVLVVSTGFGVAEPIAATGTSPTYTQHPGPTSAAEARSALAPVTMHESAQAAYLLDQLGITKSGLADILGISRTALYGWLAGKPASVDNSQHLARITACVMRAAEGRHVPCYRRYVTERIVAKTPAIAELLTDKAFDPTQVVRLLTKAWEMSEQRTARSDRSADRQTRWKGLPVTAEERRSNAEVNQLMHDIERGERG